MRSTLLVLAVLIAGMVDTDRSSPDGQGYCSSSPALATCTGKSPCSACKNCKSCRHCKKEGGTCGTCAQ